MGFVGARPGGALLVAGVLALVVSGCAAPKYTYIGDSGHDLVLRVPRSWAAVDTDEALEISGVDPATFTGWAAFYDAYTKPDPIHVQLESTAAPVLLVRTVQVPEDDRDGVTAAGLREQALPSEPAQRDAAAQAGTFKLITDEAVDDDRGVGAHVVYSYKVTSGTEYVDQIVLTDPDHKAVNMVYVHCNAQCYEQRAGEINAAVTSLTLKSN